MYRNYLVSICEKNRVKDRTRTGEDRKRRREMGSCSRGGPRLGHKGANFQEEYSLHNELSIQVRLLRPTSWQSTYLWHQECPDSSATQSCLICVLWHGWVPGGLWEDQWILICDGNGRLKPNPLPLILPPCLGSLVLPSRILLKHPFVPIINQVRKWVGAVLFKKRWQGKKALWFYQGNCS